MTALHDPSDAYAVLALTGSDSRSFLNGQCTLNVLHLQAGGEHPTAVLTPQGRILAFGWVRAVDDGLRLALASDLIEEVRAHLQRYVLRAKVRLSVAPLEAADLPISLRGTGVDASNLGCIRAGLPRVSAATKEEWIAQMLNLDLIGAVSFDKGCYTGQEIVARTQHLGRIKRRMFRYAHDGKPAAPMTALHLADQKVGEVVLSAATEHGSECLAVVSLEARDRTLLLADGRVCTPLPLPYSVNA